MRHLAIAVVALATLQAVPTDPSAGERAAADARATDALIVREGVLPKASTANLWFPRAVGKTESTARFAADRHSLARDGNLRAVTHADCARHAEGHARTAIQLRDAPHRLARIVAA